MENTVLEELMTIKKKGDSSKEKRQTFKTHLVEMLKNEGFSEKTETYIKDGFPFCGAEPVMQYLDDIQTPGEKSACYTRLFDSKMFRDNERGIAFKMTIHMLAIEIKKDNPDEMLIDKLVRLAPIKTTGKEGEQLKDSGKIIEKYFLKELAGTSPFKTLSSINIEHGYNTAFSNLIISNIETTKTFQKMSDNDKMLFLSNLGDKRDNLTCQEPEQKTDTEDVEGLGQTAPADVDKKKGDVVSIDSIIKQLQEFKNDFETIKSREIDFQLSAEKSRNIIDSLHNEIESGKRIIDNLNIKLEDQNKTISELELQVSQLTVQLDQQIQDNRRLQIENEKMDTVNSVYAADKENSINEHLNAIASKLKAEYVDFIDAERMEMNNDLGENFRCQLQSIFRILKKEGIDVEGRQ